MVAPAQRLVGRRPRPRQLVPRRAALERGEQLGGLKRLAQAIIGAAIERLDRGLRRGVGDHHDAQHVWMAPSKPGDQIDPVAATQAGVDQRHLGGEAAKYSLRGRGAVGEGDLVALHRQDIA